MRRGLIMALMLLLPVMPVQSAWTIMPADETADVVEGKLRVTPREDWNRWSSRPSDRAEIWTLDGIALNELSFFAGVRDGETLYRERDKQNMPLPRYRATMQLPEIAELFEASNRILLQSALMEVVRVEPATLAGHEGVRFAYRFVASGDEVERRGEGVAAVVDGRLYLVNFAAPAIHYFERDLPKFRALVDSIAI